MILRTIIYLTGCMLITKQMSLYKMKRRKKWPVNRQAIESFFQTFGHDIEDPHSQYFVGPEAHRWSPFINLNNNMMSDCWERTEKKHSNKLFCSELNQGLLSCREHTFTSRFGTIKSINEGKSGNINNSPINLELDTAYS